ncbi:MAG: hypothetical protein KJ970_07250 [Candidatus Eisenbacteria bacterium]|uniref:Uncharacterized protein n=1 Tax=Eiseniibacteriota bacterium TaxID=2212470 RepID=A0A948RYR9_UNCEI|nr:hypothetical protein [Candidatus Eisenbacteria bacterium]
MNKLSEHYHATNDPGDVSQTKQTVKIGVVRYRSCVTVGIGSGGLFLRVSPPLGKECKLLIPWNEIKNVKEAKLYGRQGVHMAIGDPAVGEITIYKELFEQLRGNLSGVAQ